MLRNRKEGTMSEEEEEKKEKENKERAAYSKVSTSRIYYFVPSYTRWIIRSVSFHEPMPAVPASSPVVSSEHNDSIRDPPCPHPLLPTGKRIFLLRSPLSFAPISFPYATNWKRGEHYFFRNRRKQNSSRLYVTNAVHWNESSEQDCG